MFFRFKAEYDLFNVKIYGLIARIYPIETFREYDNIQ